MGFYYPPLSDIFTSATSDVYGTFIHLIILITCTLLSFYGIWWLAKYFRQESKNWHVLMLVFSLATFIPIADMFEHFGYFPGEDFWHHVHIFLGIPAIYFIYRYVRLAHSKTVENPQASIRLLAAFLALVIGFFAVESFAESSTPSLVAGMYLLVILGTVFLYYLLWNELKTMEKLQPVF